MSPFVYFFIKLDLVVPRFRDYQPERKDYGVQTEFQTTGFLRGGLCVNIQGWPCLGDFVAVSSYEIQN